VLILYFLGRVFMRDIILLSCKECKNRNYAVTKNKKNQAGKLEIKKYCKFCNRHTPHKETKA
jgi:large subunit ribosomal protein L33